MQKINMTIGRFQPFTQGHLNMINDGDAPCIIYRISSDNNLPEPNTSFKVKGRNIKQQSIKNIINYIDNPQGDLSEQEKELLKRPFDNDLIKNELDIVKKNNKNIIDVVYVKNMFDALDRFNAFCYDNADKYEPQYWMCGDDRQDEYSSIIDKYDELETELGNEKLIPNICKGKLKVNIGNGRISGISGTDVRKAILNKDKEAFKKIMPKGVDIMFNDFVTAFDKFKNQLKKYINEHKYVSLVDYIKENKE